jgi:uracil-DNA glycosylase family 4
MLVGEQPGDLEDSTGRRSFGPAGRIPDEALAAAGTERDKVYLANFGQAQGALAADPRVASRFSTDLCRRASRERTTNDSRNSRLLA